MTPEHMWWIAKKGELSCIVLEEDDGLDAWTNPSPSTDLRIIGDSSGMSGDFVQIFLEAFKHRKKLAAVGFNLAQAKETSNNRKRSERHFWGTVKLSDHF